MTIASTQSKTIYAGNGSTIAFAVPFMFLHDEDVEVILSEGEQETLLTISTDYRLTGKGEQNGGVCTLTTPPAEGQRLVIRRNPPLVQDVDYLENDAFPAATHEAALDKLTMICQALSERLDRTITFRISSAVTGVELPAPEPGKILTWNDTGDNLTNRTSGTFDPELITLPLPVVSGGTGGTSRDEALTSLGFGTTGMNVAGAETTLDALAAMGAEPADTAILKSDMNDLLRAAFGDEAQIHTGSDLSGLTVARNHICWTLSADSQFSDTPFPYDGTYIFHIYPAGFNLDFAAAYKRVVRGNDFDPTAGEVRVAVEMFNGRKSIVSIASMEK